MIDLYTWTTPNGRKVSILLEELGVPYEVHAIDIGKGAQFEPDFLAISPNNKIPAIVDREAGVSLFESGAILLYLAEKHGQFLGAEGARPAMLQWLMWQMGGLGPMAGQAHHFLQFNPGVSDYAEKRFGEETQRLYGVLDQRLAGRDYVADEYSIADMAIWPWVSRFEWQRIDLGEFPNVKRWYLSLLDRPAVRKGYHVPKEMGEIPRP
ncbi:MAG: glutathione S-transferase N-terminal domain-containing protein [Pseudomonadota bacterium]